jgi:hypothetical protein
MRTDHYALKFLLDQRLSTIPRHAWVRKLFGYELSIEYLPGKANMIVDALSRRDEGCAMALALSSPTFTLFDDLRREMTELEDVIHLLEMIRKGEAVDKWSAVNRVVVSSRQCGVTRRWWRREKMSAVTATAERHEERTL